MVAFLGGPSHPEMQVVAARDGAIAAALDELVAVSEEPSRGCQWHAGGLLSAASLGRKGPGGFARGRLLRLGLPCRCSLCCSTRSPTT
jgi:hypothetical protein